VSAGRRARAPSTEGSGSERVRHAPREAADPRPRTSAVRLEAEAAADSDDRAEAGRVRADMDAIAVAWKDA
jgi:hypothetical protein